MQSSYYGQEDRYDVIPLDDNESSPLNNEEIDANNTTPLLENSLPSNEIKCYEHSRYLLASFFTGGKMIQAAGVNTYGLKKTFDAYFPGQNDAFFVAMTLLLTANACSTFYTHGIKNFEYCLPPKIYVANNFDTHTHSYRASLLHETYIISKDTENGLYSLYKILDDQALKKYKLENQGYQLLIGLYDSLSPLDFSEPVKLGLNNLNTFNEIKRQKQLTSPWSTFVNILYYIIIIPFFFSMFFSTMVAYLSSASFTDELRIIGWLKIVLICWAVLSNFISYCNFILTTMNIKATGLCQSITDDTFKNTFNLPVTLLIPVTILTAFNLGFAYFSMSGFFEMPGISNTDFALNCRMGFVITNIYASIFTGIFNFSANSYDQTKKISESKCQLISGANAAITSAIVIDTTFNCLGGFLGILGILKLVKISDKSTGALLLAGTIAASYDYVTLGIARNDSEKAIHYLGMFCGARGNSKTKSITSEASAGSCFPRPTIGTGDGNSIEQNTATGSTSPTGFSSSASNASSNEGEVSLGI